MTDKMKAFLEEVEKDAAFAEKVNGADSVETVIALAKEKGYELSEEDLQLEAATGELDDAELDDVAGGMVINPLGVWSGLTALLSRRFGGANANPLVYKGGKPTISKLPYTGGTPTMTTLQHFSGNQPGVSSLVHYSSDEDEAHRLYNL